MTTTNIEGDPVAKAHEWDESLSYLKPRRKAKRSIVVSPAKVSDQASARAAYEEFLDRDGEVIIAGVAFYPSRILHDLDPTAYHGGLLDFLDAEGIDADRLAK